MFYRRGFTEGFSWGVLPGVLPRGGGVQGGLQGGGLPGGFYLGVLPGVLPGGGGTREFYRIFTRVLPGFTGVLLGFYWGFNPHGENGLFGDHDLEDI